MPRTCSSALRTTIAATSVSHYLRVQVADADGTLRDCSALGTYSLDLFDGAQWGETLDQPVGTGTLTIRRDTNADSASPLVAASTINKNALSQYAPLFEKGRAIVISAATMAPGSTPAATDWHEMFRGRIDAVHWHDNPMTIDISDLGAWLVDAWIQSPTQFITASAPGSGPLLGAIIQSMLDAVVPPAGSIPLYQPVTAPWQPYTTTPTQPGSLLATARDLAQAIGWELRYRYDASDNFRLTLYQPPRTNTTPDWVIGPTEYRKVTNLETSIADIRNYIKGYYNVAAVSQNFVVSQSSSSITKYGGPNAIPRFMQIASALITNATDMQALTDAILSDLSEAAADQEIEMPFFFPVQIGDVIQFTANGDHYDSDQILAVVGYKHAVANGEGSTTIQARGKVAGAYKAWLALEGPPDFASENDILRVSESESPDGLTATLALVVGAAVDHVQAYYRTIPITTDPTQAADFSDTAVLPIDGVLVQRAVSAATSFSFPQPKRGYKLVSRLVPWYLSPGGTYAAGESVVFPVNAAPPAINVQLHPTRSGNLVSVSGTASIGISDAPGSLAVIETVLGVDTTLLTINPVAAGTLTLDPAVQTVLANRTIAAGVEKVTWRAEYTDVSGQVWKFGDFSALPALVTASVTASENTTTRQTTLTASVIDSGGYLNPSAQDPLDNTKVGALTAHLTLKGVTTAIACTSIPVSGTTGDYTFVINLDPTRPILVTVYRHYVDGSTDVLWSNALDSNKISDVVNAGAVNNGLTANVPVQFDNDTAVGASCARYSLDGGSTWTPGTVASDFSALFTGIARTASVQTMILQGKNALDGAWGNQTSIQIDPYTADVPSLTASYQSLTSTTGQVVWSCALGTVTLAIDSGTPSTPSASPIPVTLDSNVHSYNFVATRGSQTIAVSVTVPSLSAAGVGSKLKGNFDTTSNTLLASGNPGQVRFAWTQTGFDATVAYNIYVRDAAKYADQNYHYDGVTAANATHYDYSTPQNLSGGIGTPVTIGFFAEATVANTNGPRSTPNEQSYGTT